MASMTNCYTDYLCKGELKNVRLGIKVGYFGSRNVHFPRKMFSFKANSGSYKSVETTNEKKVNGKHVHGAPFLGDRNRESVEEADHKYLQGRFVEGQYVYRQTFVIRSYEIGPDKTATMETLMNLLQETALNHVTCSGLAGNGFGATHEMSLKNLIWVVTRIHVQVDKYSSWGDVVEIDTWVGAAGKTGMRRDYIIRDYKTQKIITRATSTWVIMNRDTRRLCKIPNEVKDEVEPFYLNRAAIAKEDADCEKIEKLTDGTAERIRSGLAPRWSDMDANQHVNNVKYIGWILESVPMKVLEDYYLTSMTLEYRRECRQSNILDSMTSIKSSQDEDSKEDSGSSILENGISSGMECTHLLRMQGDKAEIVRARSVWKSKPKKTV